MRVTPDLDTIGERAFKELYDELKLNFDASLEYFKSDYAEYPEDYEDYSVADFIYALKEYVYDN